MVYCTGNVPLSTPDTSSFGPYFLSYARERRAIHILPPPCWGWQSMCMVSCSLCLRQGHSRKSMSCQVYHAEWHSTSPPYRVTTTVEAIHSWWGTSLHFLTGTIRTRSLERKSSDSVFGNPWTIIWEYYTMWTSRSHYQHHSSVVSLQSLWGLSGDNLDCGTHVFRAVRRSIFMALLDQSRCLPCWNDNFHRCGSDHGGVSIRVVTFINPFLFGACHCENLISVLEVMAKTLLHFFLLRKLYLQHRTNLGERSKVTFLHRE